MYNEEQVKTHRIQKNTCKCLICLRTCVQNTLKKLLQLGDTYEQTFKNENKGL